MSLAHHNLAQDWPRFLLSIAGVALAVMLILLLNGFLSGMYVQIGAYLVNTPGSVVVAQDEVRNLLGVSSLLPPSAGPAARGGGNRVIPILSQFVILDLHEKKQPVYLVGYDRKEGGGPWRLSAGVEPRTNYEVVFDRVLALRHGVTLGERVEIIDRDFTVVGLSEGTSSWMTSFVFVRKDAVERLLRIPGGTSFLFVSPPTRTSAELLRERLGRVPGVEVLLKDELIANDAALFGKVFSVPIRLMVVIAFFVGTLFVGLVIYTATLERQREYGVLKAIGAPNSLLYRTVLAQALIIAGLGSLAGVGLAFGAAALIIALRPQFLVVLEPKAIAWTLLCGLGMALLAALAPARTIAGLAPADVFRK